MSDRTALHRERASVIRREMGGPAKIARLHERGKRTIRERIDDLLDPDSFEELGTFAVSKRKDDRADTPGDGKVGGFGRIDGRPVVVYGDDVTVRQGSSAMIGMRKTHRLEILAHDAGCPIVDIGETGGGRIPDILGSAGITGVGAAPDKRLRNREVPAAAIVVGGSFGGSSVQSARSDFTVQLRGSCLAITSPRVFEVAIGERITFEELGGVDVHAEVTGQIDLAVDTEQEAWDAVRRWLAYLPSNMRQPAPRAQTIDPREPLDDAFAVNWASAPRDIGMRALLDRVLDAGSLLEIRHRLDGGTIAGYARIDGRPVGVVATDPAVDDGRLTADGCEKVVRILTNSDAFDLPVVSFVASAGYAADDAAGQARVLMRAARLRQAFALASCPRLLVHVGDAAGLAFASATASGWGAQGAFAWPSASSGALGASSRSAYEVAGVMAVDEIIDPCDTRAVLVAHLERLSLRDPRAPHERLLRFWSTC